MFGSGPGHNSRLNGASSGRGGMNPMMYNFVQSQGSHQHHTHPQQHHQTLQQDHTGHSTPGGTMSGTNLSGTTLNHSGYSSTIMPNANIFTPSSHQNGHTPGSRAGQSQPISEHMAEQLRYHKESTGAHEQMTGQHQPHFFARIKASENRGVGLTLTSIIGTNTNAPDANEGEDEDRGRPVAVEKTDDRQDWHSLDLSGQGLRAVSLTLFDHYTFIEELYLPSNNLTYLPDKIGQLRKLRHLDLSYNQLTELPPELGMCTNLRKLLVFNNQIQDLPVELGSLQFLEILGYIGNPLKRELKQRLEDDGTKSLIKFLKENAPIPVPPKPREPVILQEDVSPQLERIRVLSWNILCDKYATSQAYGYTPSLALEWEHRRDNIIAELRAFSADVMCLQEVAYDAFETFFTPELAKNDYRGLFWPKMRHTHMRDRTEQGLVDGCAIFYNNTKYMLLDKQLIDFRSTAINRPDFKQTEDVFNRVMPKDNIGVFCLLESRATGARFIVVNAHLCWEGHLADVKAIQTGILMESVTKFSERYTRKPPVPLGEKRLVRSPETDEVTELPTDAHDPAPSQDYRTNTDIPLFVCGDYNSTVESSVYELLDKGRVSNEHPDLAGYNYGNFTRDGISHPFSLRSAYAHVQKTPDDLTFTNYTPTFSGVIDYIWYSTNTLEAIELLGPPDYDYLKRVPGFPNHHFPSDHIQIMTDFVIKARKDKKGL